MELGSKSVVKTQVGSHVIYQDSDGWMPLLIEKSSSSSNYQKYVFIRRNGENIELAGGIYASLLYFGLVFALPDEYLKNDWKLDKTNSSIYLPRGGSYGGNSESHLEFSNEKHGIIMSSTDSKAYGQYPYTIDFYIVLTPVKLEGTV